MKLVTGGSLAGTAHLHRDVSSSVWAGRSTSRADGSATSVGSGGAGLGIDRRYARRRHRTNTFAPRRLNIALLADDVAAGERQHRASASPVCSTAASGPIVTMSSPQ